MAIIIATRMVQMAIHKILLAHDERPACRKHSHLKRKDSLER